MMKFESALIRSGSSPENTDARRSYTGTGRGDTPATASAIAAMCSGVVPQHPPTPFTSPLRANSPSSPAVISGLSS